MNLRVFYVINLRRARFTRRLLVDRNYFRVVDHRVYRVHRLFVRDQDRRVFASNDRFPARINRVNDRLHVAIVGRAWVIRNRPIRTIFQVDLILVTCVFGAVDRLSIDARVTLRKRVFKCTIF